MTQRDTLNAAPLSGRLSFPPPPNLRDSRVERPHSGVAYGVRLWRGTDPSNGPFEPSLKVCADPVGGGSGNYFNGTKKPANGQQQLAWKRRAVSRVSPVRFGAREGRDDERPRISVLGNPARGRRCRKA